MHRKLPPLKALRAFEAVARHKSFTRAAEELGVTQGAISRQVGLLEDFLGMRLLERGGKYLALSQAAEHYSAAVTAAFDGVAHATERLAGAKGNAAMLTINILPSLSSRWLIPLLDDFRRLNPRLGVRVITGDGPVDFNAPEADIAIRVSRKNDWKGLHAEPIMGEELLPVLSPSLLKRHMLKKPEDFLRMPLLQHTSRPDMWPEYLEGIGMPSPRVNHALGFEHFFMLIEAALDGMGIALIPRFLITKELGQGRLAIAYTKPYHSRYRYYLICPKQKTNSRKIRLFRRWLARIIATDSLPKAVV